MVALQPELFYKGPSTKNINIQLAITLKSECRVLGIKNILSQPVCIKKCEKSMFDGQQLVLAVAFV